MKVQGTIKKILPSKQDAKRLSILIDGEWFSLFTKDGTTNLKRGSIIEAEYLTKGIFHNIDEKSIKVIGNSAIIDMVDESQDDKVESMKKQALLKASAFYSQSAEDNINNAKILYKSIGEEW